MEERPISDAVERLNELRNEQIPTEVDELTDLVRRDLEQVRTIVDDAHVSGLTAQIDDIAMDMLKQLGAIGDAADAAASTGTSQLNALLRPVVHLASTSRTYRPIMRHPPEDRIIVVDDDATYNTGQYGRIISVRATLTAKPPGKRNERAQKRLPGKVLGDDAGHLIARDLGGIGL